MPIAARERTPSSNVAFIGSTSDVLACMFPPRAEAHVVQWRRWKFLFARGIIDAASITLVGRRAGEKFISEI